MRPSSSEQVAEGLGRFISLLSRVFQHNFSCAQMRTRHIDADRGSFSTCLSVSVWVPCLCPFGLVSVALGSVVVWWRWGSPKFRFHVSAWDLLLKNPTLKKALLACDDCTRMHPVLRLYVLILGLYELPLIYSSFKAMHSKKPFTGFSSSLVPGAAERRIWIFLLTVLSISRFVAVAFPDDPGALANLALIHVAEAVYMGSERLIYNSKGGGLVILGIIFGNGILFSCVAIMA